MKNGYYIVLIFLLFACTKVDESLPKLYSAKTQDAVYLKTDRPYQEVFEVLYLGKKVNSITFKKDKFDGIEQFIDEELLCSPQNQVWLNNVKKMTAIDSINTQEAKDLWQEYAQQYPFNNELGDKTFLDEDGGIISNKKEKMRIFVDTTQVISTQLHWKNNVNLNREYFAYPVFIENLGTSELFVGVEQYFGMIKEAKNPVGEWQRINNQEGPLFFCGTGLQSLALPKNNLAITSTIIDDGDFETEIRVRIGGNVSNSYTGKINLFQFFKQCDIE